MYYGASNDLVIDRLPAGYQYQPWLEPRLGIPYLLITPMAKTDPEMHNKVNYDDAPWLYRAIDDKGNFAEIDKSLYIAQYVRNGTAIKIDNAEMEGFFDFYRKAKINTPFFEVRFPDGAVRYYDVRFLEEP
jgi:hypothetical protein